MVADREVLSLAEMIAVLRTACGRPPRGFAVPPPLIAGLLRAAGRTASWDQIGGALVVDPGKLLATGWQPSADTRAGLATMMRAHTSAAMT
ncbi:hypothetical protein [Rhodoplanes sp. SY1]|uniref:hypothetical protein n=1 Tax=Rhodoplanes sp. SY1 TaxID=3166646 RepID=UPI0038B4F5EC